MARTAIAFGPSGFTSVTLRVINPADDSIVETINLTEDTNGKGKSLIFSKVNPAINMSMFKYK